MVLISIILVGVVGGTNVISLDADETPAFEELQAGTSALDADTDGDGLQDTTEIDGPTDPTVADTDGDGLDDKEELEAGSDPTIVDTDNDGLNDESELSHGTDPTDSDTDDDGLTDGHEVTLYSTDPTTADTDDDGLNDETEVNGDTDPNEADTDSDGLDDGPEVEKYGTDPTESDTDGDGLPDGAEVNNLALINSDPLQMDIFVEVDYMSGQRPSESALESVQDAYADAPVDNPDGSSGINLYIAVDESISAEDRTNLNETDRLKDEHYDHKGDGYHYGIAVVHARFDGEDAGGAAQEGQFIFETEYDSGREWPSSNTAGLFMHELGHSVGISSEDYRGVDSEEVPYDEYQSRMNYNSDYGATKYNDGRPFDDWQHIENCLYTPKAGSQTVYFDGYLQDCGNFDE